MKIFNKIVMLLVASIVVTTDVYADAITVYKTMLPQRFMLVDKKTQRCILYGVDNSTDPISYTCSTGQVDGDKIIEGDKKTPAGAYFVTGSILEGLDFEEYGSRAYPLNYPNPIDTIERKTGYGIWVHGKGKEFKTKDTRGCVAFPEKDVLVVYPNFVVSYPVIIADTVTLNTTEPSEDYVSVSSASKEWASHWSEQVDTFFTYYDSNKKANFKHFKNNKKHVFSRFNFTFVDIDEPYIVRKGKYYTTWFRQYYYAPNMIIEGIRYLYWEMGADNKARIIAEEWKPDSTSKTKQSLEAKLAPKIDQFVNEWKESWESGNVQKYMEHYANNASQGNVRGKQAIAKSKERNWKRNKPKNIKIENMKVKLTPEGIQVTFKQTYTASGNYKDVGEKTLYIVPQSRDIDKWKITKETWHKR